MAYAIGSSGEASVDYPTATESELETMSGVPNATSKNSVDLQPTS